MFHNPSHPSGKITDRTIRQRYVWPDMHRDIAKWCKNCIECQQAKVSRHVKLTPEHFVAPDGRFDQIHIDIVGPLPPSEGYSYCLTMIDRFSPRQHHSKTSQRKPSQEPFMMHGFLVTGPPDY